MPKQTTDLSRRAQRQIVAWLLLCCVLIFSMVVLGGVTRLTRSGLSMVDWHPVMGVVPPLGSAQWQQIFEKYQAFPEYKEINRGMSLGEFKSIYWMEYSHRLLGRLIGIVFLLPLLYFLYRGYIRGHLIPKTIIMFILGGMQGVLGWYMVKSGLVNNPHVSQYRLTAHLITAFAIYAYILWVALGLLSPRRKQAGGQDTSGLWRFSVIVTATILVTVVAGGFVAGTKAGYVFNTYPLMNGQWIPQGYMALQPGWRNLFDNIATVQFNHRWLGSIVLVMVLSLWVYARRFLLYPQAGVAMHVLLAMTVVQFSLGILTLLWVVPAPLGVAHQAGALLLFTFALVANHFLRTYR
ncbi:MAG TPA: heme A synthase [Acidiferrobacteraceae bacterium]|nr:heme A synthase [Acidiferrobacteraceae bacterium]